MKIAFIAPPKLTEYIAPFGTALMGLAHQILEDDADSFNLCELLATLGRSRYLIVDNSMMELGQSMDLSDVIGAAWRVGADEIILPDVFQDRQGTLDLIDESFGSLIESGFTRSADPWACLMAVPQGRSQEEWLECYDEIFKMHVPSHIQTIGVPKSLAKDDPEGRIQTLQAVQNRWPDRTTRHAWHLLGVWNHSFGPTTWSMGEPIEIAKLFPWVRSVDTSLPVYGSLGFSERPPEWNDMTFDSVGPAGIVRVVQSCLYVRERLEGV